MGPKRVHSPEPPPPAPSKKRSMPEPAPATPILPANIQEHSSGDNGHGARNIDTAPATSYTANDQKASGFGRIPGELRNQIAGYVITTYTATVRHVTEQGELTPPPSKRNVIALGQICRLLRAENLSAIRCDRTVSLLAPDLRPYLESVYPLVDRNTSAPVDPTTITDYVGNILIRFDLSLLPRWIDLTPLVTPLVTHLSQVPLLRVKYTFVDDIRFPTALNDAEAVDLFAILQCVTRPAKTDTGALLFDPITLFRNITLDKAHTTTSGNYPAPFNQGGIGGSRRHISLYVNRKAYRTLMNVPWGMQGKKVDETAFFRLIGLDGINMFHISANFSK